MNGKSFYIEPKCWKGSSKKASGSACFGSFVLTEAEINALFDEEHRKVLASAMKKKLTEWGLDYQYKRLDIQLTLEYIQHQRKN